ncbi:ABC transporter permease [Embleya sp. NPDC020630]|uniref:ABC transporter permease n=1 Tax=Embleya sp. NPDC020630 TaxID=3363979 RepID=UPI0037A1BE6A
MENASTLLPVTPALGVVAVVLLTAATAVAALARLGHGRAVVLSGVRATAQLLAVSFVITHVVDRLGFAALFVVMMYTVAALTAAGRVTATRRLFWPAVPIVAATGPTLVLLWASGLVPAKGIVLIPIAGILIGGAMTATVLAGRRALEELTQRHGEVEAALTLGFTDRDAAMEICRPAASGALIPALDQTRTVGLVTLPGAFVGMLLGGATPLQAGAVQLFVLIALLQVQAVAVALTIELAARGRLVRAASGQRDRGGSGT